MTEQTKSYFDNIADTFAGSDGGIRFLKLKMLIDAIDEKEDEASKEIIKLVVKFSTLIDVANKKGTLT